MWQKCVLVAYRRLLFSLSVHKTIKRFQKTKISDKLDSYLVHILYNCWIPFVVYCPNSVEVGNYSNAHRKFRLLYDRPSPNSVKSVNKSRQMIINLLLSLVIALNLMISFLFKIHFCIHKFVFGALGDFCFESTFSWATVILN